MKNLLSLTVFLAITLIATISFAQERHRWVGFNVDLGIPDGAALGVVVRPKVDWLRLNLAGTYNVLSPGIRGGLTFDPINFGVAPTLTVEGGHAFQGTIPGSDKSPHIYYNYFNLHPGLEFGKRDVWRLYLHGGISWLDISATDFKKALDSVDSSLSLGTAHANIHLFPSAKLGLTYYF